MFPSRRRYVVPLAGNRVLSLGERPLIMGVLNVTPDSFAESSPLVVGAAVDAQRAVDEALRMEADGADLIDVGGESTRPGAEALSAQDERARVLPVIRQLVGQLRIPMSIDTYKAKVARAALAEGVALVNDVSGLQYDPSLGRAVCEAGAAMVLMHTRGRSKVMYDEAVYADLMAEVAGELRQSMWRATEAGVALERLILDPGVGFAKRPTHSYGVLARIDELAQALGRPILVGPSRKSYLREALDDRPATDRDWGTAAAVTAAVLGGAHIVRVHAVAAMRQVVRVAEEVRRAAPGADRA